MPELPEVETIRRTLAPNIEGKKICAVDILLERQIKWPSAQQFKELVLNRKIIKLKRRGKYLLFHLTGDIVMVVHLRMTGRLNFRTAGQAEDNYTRLRFVLEDSNMLVFADTRTLGTIYAVKSDELWRIGGLSGLGPEPLSASFTLEYFEGLLEKHKGNIKALLLNQKYIGGLGNIYADESLAYAGVSPKRKANSLNKIEREKLYQAINFVIAEGIKNSGTTFRDYRDGLGKRGSNQRYLWVYGRKNQPCKKCGTAILWEVIAGRGTSYCPNCQK